VQFILLFLLYGIGEIVSLCKFSVLLFSSMLPSVCDESRYMIVRNVPALGCGDDLMRLFMTYGEVEE
jgi:hypothetical protein